MKQAILILTDGTQKEISPANGTNFTLQECYKLIGCDMIEIIRLADGRVMIIDEEGKFKDDFQINYVASKMFMQGRKSVYDTMQELKRIHGNRLIDATDGDFEGAETIVGNVIVCSPKMFK
jgi:hypothetical protein